MFQVGSFKVQVQNEWVKERVREWENLSKSTPLENYRDEILIAPNSV